MIVFTIYKNGGNAGVLGASFSCAVFGVLGSSGVNAGRVNAGSLCVLLADFQSDGGLSRLRFDHQLRFGVARIRSVRELGRQNVRPFIGRALCNWGGWCSVSAFAFTVVLSCGRY